MSKNKKCHFCQRSEDQVNILIQGLEAFICDDCIHQADTMLKGEKEEEQKYALNLMKPKDIKAKLDEYVIGQTKTKINLSVAVYNHFKRLNQQKDPETTIEKSNIVMVGPTGTGKTLLARTLSKILKVPFCIADATVVTEAGYVGEDIESILSRLLQAAQYNVKAAEMGIVYIDEIDKIARKGDNASITRDVSGEGVQQGLLKLLEGSIVNIPPEGGRKHPHQKFISINTQNILFICGGAFDGIEKQIAQRLNRNIVGFKKDLDTLNFDDNQYVLQHVNSQDLKNYGLIPELIGRLPIITHLEPLDRKALKRILTEPKNALLKQYQELFALENVELIFTEEALNYIVEEALTNKLGARGLRSICEKIMLEPMFSIPSQKQSIKRLVMDKNTLLKYIDSSTLLQKSA